MTVTASEKTASLPTVSARATAAAPAATSIPAAAAQTALATAARGAGPDPLLALLQGANDPPDLQLPASNLARRYAETGVLSQTANRPATSAPASSLQANAAQTAAPAASAQPANTAQQASGAQAAAVNTAPVIMIDGRAIALNPAQAIAVRAALGSSVRQIGPGTGASDSEDPTAITPESVLESSKTEGHKVTPLAGSPHSTTDDQQRTVPLPFVRRQVDQGAEVEQAHEVRRAGPAPFEPAPISEKSAPAQTIMPVAPDIAVLESRTETASASAPKAFTGMAIAFAPGVTPDQVSAETYNEGYKITVEGHQDYFFIGAKDALNAQLVFANGSVLRIALLPANRLSQNNESN